MSLTAHAAHHGWVHAHRVALALAVLVLAVAAAVAVTAVRLSTGPSTVPAISVSGPASSVDDGCATARPGHPC